MTASTCVEEAIKLLKSVPECAGKRLPGEIWAALSRAMYACGEVQGLLPYVEDLRSCDPILGAVPSVPRSLYCDRCGGSIPDRTTSHAAIPNQTNRSRSLNVSSRGKSTKKADAGKTEERRAG